MQQSTMALQNVIDQISQEKGIDPKVLIEAVEQAILTAAKRTFGPTRELEARFNEENGSVDLFQYMTVTETVMSPEREISAADAKRHGLDADMGEELGFQIFYLPEHADEARKQDQEFGDLLKMQQYRHGFGYPALHAFWIFYELEYALQRAGAVIMAGTSNPGAFRELGLQTAASFDEAWKIARRYVGANPTTVVAPTFWTRPRIKFSVKA